MAIRFISAYRILDIKMSGFRKNNLGINIKNIEMERGINVSKN